jgi:cytochrome c2
LKKLFLVLLAVAAIANAAEDAKTPHVVAYYFHGTMRCPTCHKLEQYSKEAIGAGLKAVNVEKKENEHYVKDYQLYTKSLILSLVKDGKEIKWKNLDKIWEYVGNKQRFIDYVKSGVADFLKEAE